MISHLQPFPDGVVSCVMCVVSRDCWSDCASATVHNNRTYAWGPNCATIHSRGVRKRGQEGRPTPTSHVLRTVHQDSTGCYQDAPLACLHLTTRTGVDDDYRLRCLARGLVEFLDKIFELRVALDGFLPSVDVLDALGALIFMAFRVLFDRLSQRG